METKMENDLPPGTIRLVEAKSRCPIMLEDRRRRGYAGKNPSSLSLVSRVICHRDRPTKKKEKGNAAHYDGDQFL
jgi:hypothetical protein